MHRRRVLATGAIGLAGALAGCLGSGREPLEERPPENAVEDAIMLAVGEANTAAVELAAAQAGDLGAPGDVAIDPAPLEDRLATARGHLDEAEGLEGADAYEADLAAARSYVDVVDGLVGASADLAEAADDRAVGESAVDAGEYARAAEELGDVQPAVADAATTASEAEAAAADLDGDRLDRYGAQVERVGDGLDELSSLAVGADALAEGYGTLFDGRDHLVAGREAFEAGDYAAAESEFQAAEDRFADATSSFRRGRDAIDDDALDARLEVALCRSTNLETAAGHFAGAAAAADDGDPFTAESEYQAGEDAVDAAARCG